MSFEDISSVLEHGARKQLDFEDLLELPVEMDPLSCHLMLLSCWERQKNTDHPSLFRAICSAYGWSYIRLGLLKVFLLRSLFFKKCKTLILESKTGHSSIFRAICSAYGWSNIRLGLLKVYLLRILFLQQRKTCILESKSNIKEE